ncbi:Protocadherin Fat 4 [Mactra antiquata]
MNVLGSILVLYASLSLVNCACELPSPGPFFVKETDPQGTEIFDGKKTRDDTVSFNVHGPVSLGTALLNLLQQSLVVSFNDTGYVFVVNKTLDLEEFFVDYGKVVSEEPLKITFTCGGSTRDFLLAVTPVNNFKPTFNNAPYNISIPESLKVGASVFSLKERVVDQDVGMAQNFVFKIEAYNTAGLDGRSKFSIPTATSGIVNLTKLLDFDNDLRIEYILNISVADGTGAGSLTSYTTLHIYVTDVDDQVPYFEFPDCSIPCVAPPFVSTTRLTYTGPLTLAPKMLQGIDSDTLGAVLRYRIATGNDAGLFRINEENAEVTQIRSVNNAQLPDAQFRLVIEVYKKDYPTLKSIAILTVHVFERTTNDTGLPGPPTGGSSSDTSSGTNIIPIVVLAILLVLAITAAIVILIMFRKNQREMAIRPSDDKSEPQTEEEELDGDDYNSKGFSNEKLVFGNKTTLGIMTDEFPPTPTERANTLPPLPLKDTATETMETSKKKRSRRRNKNKEPEIFDGTREYNMGMDPEFFEATDKSKIKRSQRSKKIDNSQQINITNDQGDVDSGYMNF